MLVIIKQYKFASAKVNPLTTKSAERWVCKFSQLKSIVFLWEVWENFLIHLPEFLVDDQISYSQY